MGVGFRSRSAGKHLRFLVPAYVLLFWRVAEKNPTCIFSWPEVLTLQGLTAMPRDSCLATCPGTCPDKVGQKLDSQVTTRVRETLYVFGQKARRCPSCPRIHPLPGGWLECLSGFASAEIGPGALDAISRQLPQLQELSTRTHQKTSRSQEQASCQSHAKSK
jgi:hypothetical protein